MKYCTYLALVLLILLPSLPSLATGVQDIDVMQSRDRLTASVYVPLTLERVIDGDTIVASGRKIRLWGIDAPEKGEHLYAVSTKVLELFLETGVLECKFIEKDRYKRDVMHCLSDGGDISALMVKAGFARDYTKYSGGLYQGEELFAQDGKLGIWE